MHMTQESSPSFPVGTVSYFSLLVPFKLCHSLSCHMLAYLGLWHISSFNTYAKLSSHLERFQ